MTKNFIKKLVSIALIATLIFTCACNDKNNDSGSLQSLNEVKIWSATSSQKIRQEDVEYANKGPSSLSFYCVKGETESVQLMLTPNKKVNYYTLTAQDLSDKNGNKIIASDFEIYAESYMDILQLSNGSSLYPAGAYPDALIPMGFSINAGENFIEANKNQGIWILVNVNRDTPAGVYSGSFELKMDSVTTYVPVSVTVYDVELPEEATMDTVFLNRRENILMGEHDSTEELMVRYFEQMLEYRITLCDIPVYSGDPEEYAEFIDKYFDNPNLTTYIIPYKTITGRHPTIGNYLGIDMEFFKAHVKALAKRSTAERDLVKDAKLYTYSITDEPEMNGGEYNVVAITEDLRKAKQEIINELLRSDPEFFDGKENLKESILNVGAIITGGVDSLIMRGYVDIYCPMLNLFHTEAQRQNIYDVCEEYDSELWWYGCIAPRNPFCTYHIDDNLLGSRILSWMQADYGIKGNLYYDISAYGKASSYDSNLTVPCNPYEDPLRWDNVAAVNGDGFLVYPGSKYDYFGFIPSIRLMSIRDGMEEYELLIQLEETYKNLSSFYDQEIDGKAILNEMYTRLYTGTIPTTDTDLFDDIRLELLTKAEESNSDNKFLIEKIDVKGEQATISILLSNEYSIKINGSAPQNYQVAGNGMRYLVQLDLSQGTNWIEAEVTNKQNPQDVTIIRRFISGKLKVVNSFEDASLKGISVSENSYYSLNTNADYAIIGNSLYAEVSSVIKNDEAFNQNFYPTLNIMNSGWLFLPDLKTVSTLEFDLLNVGNESYTVTVNLIAGKQMRSAGTFIIGNNGYTHIRLDIAGNTWSKLSEVEGIAIVFENKGSVDAPTVYTFYVDNMYVTYK